MSTRPARLSRGTALAMLALGSAIGVLLALQVSLRSEGPAAAAAQPWPLPSGGPDPYVMGATTLPLARNAWRSWQPSDLESVNAFEQSIRRHLGVVMWYVDWEHGLPSRAQLDAVAARGSIPEITWEPWNARRVSRDQPKYRLSNIVAGQFDPYIRAWARALAAYGRPVRLRFAHEMNGRWYPWSEVSNGNRAGEFVKAWRHVHSLFDAAGASNVQWVWSPAAITIRAVQYPGDAYVDIVSLTAFNGGSQLRYSPWRSFARVVRRPLEQLRAIAPEKPLEYSEVGCAEEGGDRAAWIAGMLEAIGRQPQGTTLIWYDLPKSSDWRIENSAPAASAYAAGVEALNAREEQRAP